MSEREVVLMALVAFAGGTYVGAIGGEVFALLRLLREAAAESLRSPHATPDNEGDAQGGAEQ